MPDGTSSGGGPAATTVEAAAPHGAVGWAHDVLVFALCAQITALAVLGLARGLAPLDVLAYTLALALIALAARFSAPPIGPGATVVGLVTLAAIAVGVFAGAATAHLQFALAVAAAAVYRDRRLLTLAAALTVAYELIAASWLGTPPEPGMAAAAIWVTMTVSCLAVLIVVAWRVNADPPPVRQRHKDRFAELFDAAPVAMALMRPSGRIVAANPSLGRLLDMDHNTLRGSNIESIVHPGDFALLGQVWEEVGNGDDHQASVQIRCRSGANGLARCRLTLTLVPRTRNSPAVIVLVAEEAQPGSIRHAPEPSGAQRRQMLAAIGDELRVPLGSLIDLTHVDAQGEVAPRLRRIEAHALEISTVVDDLVVSARFGERQVPVAPEFVDTALVCRRVLKAVPDLSAVRAQIRPVPAWADPKLTRQVLSGLMANAMRRRHGPVTIRNMAAGPETVIQVIDDGPEIGPDDLARLFQTDLDHAHPGYDPVSLGLSLTVGRKLARRMGGDIRYRRTEDGRNVFELRLPIDPSAQVAAPPDAREVEAIPTGG